MAIYKVFSWPYEASSRGPIERQRNWQTKAESYRALGLQSSNPIASWETRVIQNPRERLCWAQPPKGQRPSIA